MTKQHSIKRSLVASILILCLCFTSLIGTTFAWFTDSVTSANNIIKTGKLDIGLEYATVKDGQISGWSNVDGADEIFDPNALWEPGRVEVAYLKVSNLGDLALKYKLAVNIVEEKEGTNVDGEKFKLSDHLVFGNDLLGAGEGLIPHLHGVMGAVLAEIAPQGGRLVLKRAVSQAQVKF